MMIVKKLDYQTKNALYNSFEKKNQNEDLVFDVCCVTRK